MARRPVAVDIPAIGALDRSRGSLSRQLAEALRESVRKGDLKPGDPLPSSRTLAKSLQVARGIVSEAFEQLVAEGILEAMSKSGTRVSGALAVLHREGTKLSATPLAGSKVMPASLKRYERVASEFMPLPNVPFAISVPVNQTAPDDIWRRLGNKVRARGPGAPSGYDEPQGALVLREAIADYVRRSRSVRCTADQVVITSGIQQALYLCCQILLQEGDSAWVEVPAYRGLTAILDYSVTGVRTINVPIDTEGLDVSAGVGLAPNARVAFVTPSHQYPLGMPLSMSRRNALLEWAREQGAWIVEDDYDSELRYAGHPFPALQGLDPDRVIYLGTFSKILFPSLRMGYAIVPSGMENAFCGARILMDRHPPSADQHVLAAFINEGHLDRHIRRIRGVYAERRLQLVKLIEQHMPTELAWLQPSDQGMHVVLWLHKAADDLQISRDALTSGVSVRPLSPLYRQGQSLPGLILGLGDFENDQIITAMTILSSLISRDFNRS